MPVVLYLNRLWRHGVVLAARRMPLDSPPVCMAFSLLFVATASFLLPGLEVYARAIPLLAAAFDGTVNGWKCLHYVQWAMMGAAYVCAFIFQARCLQLCYPHAYDSAEIPSGRGRRRSGPGIEIAGMPVDSDDLRTSILVTGVTGSAKTAGVLMPALAQLFQRYSEETEDESSTDDLQKLGAFIPEVKGDLVDGCIYLAHEAGRCVCRDVLILSPSSRIPTVRYRDEKGRLWYLCARGGSGGSEAADILPRLAFPDGHPRAGRWAGPDVFESPSDLAAIAPALAKISVPLGSLRPRFIGWRWEGRGLVRVSHTVSRECVSPLLDSAGLQICTEPPRTLTFDGIVAIDNGLHYNLVDARLPPTEAAERITRLASMARGGERHGDNDYFYDQGRKLIAACISLHREVETTPCTAIDIVRLATQDDRLASALELLTDKIGRLRAEAGRAGGEIRTDLVRRRIGPAEDLAAYFRDEWQKLVADGKTANVIKSTISGAFDAFLRDPDLAETFCQPSTFSFEDIAQAGKIVGFVPGDRFEQLGRLLGTACKMDFQSAMLARNGRPDLNSHRLVLYFADECQKYIISGSSTAGDGYFMNLSRSNNVVNICATQSYAWIVEVIGREAANVYISAFGVQFWLQQTDPETCKRAAEICGTLTREKEGAEHNLDFGGLKGSIGEGKDIVIRRHRGTEEKERYKPEEFSHLDVGDIIAYNKGREGKTAKVAKGRAEFHFCTQKPAGVAAVNARVREYYREILENLTEARGQTERWDSGSPAPALALRTQTALSEPVAFELTEAEIEAERADFAAFLGGLDRAASDAGGMETSAIAVGIEVARAGALRSEKPAETFGALLAAGPEGFVSEDRGLGSPLGISPEDKGLPSVCDLPRQLNLAAREMSVVAETEFRAAVRAKEPRPEPRPEAFAAEGLRRLKGDDETRL